MIFNCKSSSSPHCDCVQIITVEKVDAILELKIFKNNCSTMLNNTREHCIKKLVIRYTYLNEVVRGPIFVIWDNKRVVRYANHCSS